MWSILLHLNCEEGGVQQAHYLYCNAAVLGEGMSSNSWGVDEDSIVVL